MQQNPSLSPTDPKLLAMTNAYLAQRVESLEKYVAALRGRILDGTPSSTSGDTTTREWELSIQNVNLAQQNRDLRTLLNLMGGIER